jgi:hypothetical protein
MLVKPQKARQARLFLTKQPKEGTLLLRKALPCENAHKFMRGQEKNVNRSQRIALRAALVLLFAAAALLAVGRRPPPVVAAAPQVTQATSYYYGSNGNYAATAVQSIWPQEYGPYCAIAVAMGVVNYVDLEDHQKLRFTTPSYQYVIAAANQKAGASQWGYAMPINRAAGITNIAPDVGVDPRSAAYMEDLYAPRICMRRRAPFFMTTFIVGSFIIARNRLTTGKQSKRRHPCFAPG